MLRLVPLLFLASAAVAQTADSARVYATSNPLRTPLDRRVDSLVRKFLAKTRPVGLCIGVWDGTAARVYGYGETTAGNAQLPDGNTRFEIGSITKTFTATLLAEAVQRGKVSLDDPVSRYLPDSLPPLRFNGVPVTLRTLANHTSGLPRLPGNLFTLRGGNALNPYERYGVNELFQFLKTFTLKRPPGQQFEYSNLGAGLIGTVLERVSGKTYEELVKTRIAQPLGLGQTTLTLNDADKKALATGHNERGKPVPNWDFRALAGAIRSTAQDLLRYLRAEIELQGKLADAMKLTQATTFSGQNRTIGLAWMQGESGTWHWHNGRTGGYAAFAAFSPVKTRAPVVLCNTSTDTDGLSVELLRLPER